MPIRRPFPSINDTIGEVTGALFASQISQYTDRILLVNYTSHLSNICTRSDFLATLRFFNLHSKKINPELELTPLFSTQCDFYIKENDEEPDGYKEYDDFLGKKLNNGSTSGVNFYDIQELFKHRYDSISSGLDSIRYTRNLNFVGFHWFAYSIAPHMIYNADSEPNKLRTNQLVDGIRSYHPSSNIQLEVFNPVRSPFTSGGSSTAKNGNNYEWFETDTALASHTNLSVTDPVLANCNDGVYYVKVTTANNSCAVYSVPVVVNVRNNSLYMRDFDDASDDGDEPSVGQWIYLSPDIWVNQTGNENDPHSSPIYGQKNYVFVKVRHRTGFPASKGTEQLSVYYAWASTGLTWPYSWIRKRMEVDGTEYTVGDRINKFPQIIPSISSGEEIYRFEWTPSRLPIDGTPVDEPDKDPYRHYCLLARIERTEYPPFGMSTPEDTLLPPNVRNNNNIIWRNVTIVLPGGGIVTSGGPIPETVDLVGWKTPTVLVSNDRPQATTIKLDFEKPTIAGKSLQNDARTKINLGPVLFQKWVDGGMVGSGVSISDFNIFADNPLEDQIELGYDELLTTIDIEDTLAWIGNIELDPYENRQIVVGFKFNNNLTSEEKYGFDIEQFDQADTPAVLIGGEFYDVYYENCLNPRISKISIGGQTVLSYIHDNHEIPVTYSWYRNGILIGGEILPYYKPTDDGDYQLSVAYESGCSAVSEKTPVKVGFLLIGKSEDATGQLIEQNFLFYPNLANEELSVLIAGGQQDDVVSIKVYDLLGKIQLDKKVAGEDGFQSLSLDLNNISAGSYTLEVKQGEKRIVKPLFIEK